MNGGLPGFRTPSDSCRSRIFLLRFDSKRLPLRLPFSLCCCSTPSPASEAAAATRRHVVAVFLGCEAWSGGAAPRSSSAAPTFASVRGLSRRQPSRPRWLRLCSSSRRPCWRQRRRPRGWERRRAGLPPPRREPQAEVARPALLQVRLSLPSRLSALFLGRVEPHLGALVVH